VWGGGGGLQCAIALQVVKLEACDMNIIIAPIALSTATHTVHVLW
jgi:hypothetical protein